MFSFLGFRVAAVMFKLGSAGIQARGLIELACIWGVKAGV